MSAENNVEVSASQESNTSEEKVENTSSLQNNKEEKPKEKLYTQEQLNEMIQKRLEREKRKMSEADLLSKMTEKEKQDYEYQQRLNELDERAKQIEKLEKEYERKSLLNQTEHELLEKGLPTNFASLLCSDTAENTKNNIDAFNKAWNEALSREVDKKLKQNSIQPKVNSNRQSGMSKEEFKRLSINDRAKLKAENPELFNKLK